MQHHVCTEFGIGKRFCGNKYTTLGGAGQENSISGAIY